jgi:hypothetical protein
MMRKGLIEQQIESLGLILAKLLKLKMDKNIVPAIETAIRSSGPGEDDEAVLLLRNASKELVGVNLDTVMALGDESMIGLVKTGPSLAAEKALALGVLLDEWSLICTAHGDTRGAMIRSRKALLLLAEALQHEQVSRHPEFVERFNKLVDCVQPNDLPPVYAGPMQLRLLNYYEVAGQFGKAEDALYALRDLEFPDIDQKGRQFYRRLLHLSDEELEAGGLPRNEIEEALQELG